jgi:phosphoglucosamine mutase
VLAALNAQNKSLTEVGKALTLYPQVLINVPIKHRIDMQANPAIQAAVESAEQTLNGHGRILLRASGTELKFRVMVEGQDGQLVKKLATQIADIVAEQAK